MTAPWSVSRHRAYITCPRQYWLTSVAKVPREDSPASVRGQVLHAAVAAGWAKAAVGAGADAVLGAIEVAADDEVARHERRGTQITDYDMWSWIELAALTVEHAGPKPGDTLLGVEYEVRSEVDGVPVMARLDLVYETADGTLIVRDWKSSSEVPTQDDLLRDVQLGLGALLAARHWGRTRVRVEIGSIGAQVVSGVDMPRERAQGTGERVAASARKAATDTEFTPRRSEACAECKVRRFCPLFAVGPVPEPNKYTIHGSIRQVDKNSELREESE
ncbi:MAG: RecB family exonuclease [Pseudonocardiaceae bacterium]